MTPERLQELKTGMAEYEYNPCVEECVEEITRLKAEIERLRSRLAEYADHDNWDCEDTYCERGLVVWLKGAGPEIAEAALQPRQSEEKS